MRYLKMLSLEQLWALLAHHSTEAARLSAEIKKRETPNQRRKPCRK